MATTTHDIPMLIASTTASCERRITPSWTISQLKAKLEPVTGIPVSSQQLTLVLPDHRNVVIEAKDEDAVQIGTFELIAYAKINVGQCAVLLSVRTTCWNKLQFIGTPVKYIGSSLHLRERERRSVARTCAPTSLKVFLNLVSSTSIYPLSLWQLLPALCLTNLHQSSKQVNPSTPTAKWRFSFRFFFRLLYHLYLYQSNPLISPYLGRIPKSCLWPSPKAGRCAEVHDAR